MTRVRDLGQVLVAAGVVASGLAMLAQIPLIHADAGYARIGPRFFPSVVAFGLLGLGAILLWEAWHKGFPALEEGPHDHQPFDRKAVAWVAGGLVAQMVLIGTVGFTLAGTLLGTCVARALGGRLAMSVAAAFLLSASIYHAFGWLGVNLPALVTGWL